MAQAEFSGVRYAATPAEFTGLFEQFLADSCSYLRVVSSMAVLDVFIAPGSNDPQPALEVVLGDGYEIMRADYFRNHDAYKRYLNAQLVELEVDEPRSDD